MSMTPEVYSHPALPPASGRAVAALVVGLASLFCCQLAGPVALFLSLRERKAIRSGLASPVGEGYAIAGLVIGVITTISLLIGLVVLVVWLFGGLALLAAAASR